MARIADGNATVELEMREYSDLTESWGPDFSGSFLGNGGCTWSREQEAWLVDDVDYTLSYMEDWMIGIGDFSDDSLEPSFDPANRTVRIIDDSRWYEVGKDDDQ